MHALTHASLHTSALLLARTHMQTDIHFYFLSVSLSQHSHSLTFVYFLVFLHTHKSTHTFISHLSASHKPTLMSTQFYLLPILSHTLYTPFKSTRKHTGGHTHANTRRAPHKCTQTPSNERKKGWMDFCWGGVRDWFYGTLLSCCCCCLSISGSSPSPTFHSE